MAKKKVFQISNALVEGLEETVSAAHNYSGELRVEAISLKRIELDPDNPRDLALTFNDLYHGIQKQDPEYARKNEEKAQLASLANSIIEQGIINPVMVYKFGDKYRLIAGERRSLASILAGKTEIQAKILESKPNELKISLLQWMENVERKDLSLYERLRNLEKIIEAYALSNNVQLKEVTATDISRLLGCSLPHAMNYVAILKADGTLQELIRNNKIKNLEKAALIAGIKSQDTKAAAIEACLLGSPLKKLKSIITQDKQKQRLTYKAVLPETRGRQAMTVNLGSTKKVNVARLIVYSVLMNDKLAHLKPHFETLNWNDLKAVNHAFKHLLKNLEQVEA